MGVALARLFESCCGAKLAKRKINQPELPSKRRFSFFLLIFFAFIPKVRSSNEKLANQAGL
jgi:hypothetical protein